MRTGHGVCNPKRHRIRIYDVRIAKGRELAQQDVQLSVGTLAPDHDYVVVAV